MKRFLLLLLLVTALISGCTTAQSIGDLRWERTVAAGGMKVAPLLACNRVNSCHDGGVYPDKYSVNDNQDELYVWAHRYWTFGETTVLYVVLNRPQSGTWDMLAFQFLDGEWKTGIYGGEGMVGKVPYDIWYKASVGDSFPIAFGMTSEPWAVVARPVGLDSFEYAVVPNYWNR